MSDEEKLRDFYRVHTHMQDHYIIAESMEEAIVKFRKIDQDAQIELVEFMGYLHD